jgi:hypothetical protein
MYLQLLFLVKNRAFNQGFGLLEIIIAGFIGTVILVALSGVQRLVAESYNFSFEEIQAVEEARGGIDVMVKEIREAQPSEDGGYPIEQATDQEFIFYADEDNDDRIERVRYYLDGSSLTKGTINPTNDIPAQYPVNSESTKVVADYIQNGSDPIFYYYNGEWPLSGSGNPLDTPSRLIDTKYMRVFLVVNVDPNRVPQSSELSSGVQLRNLKTNL